MKEFEFYDTLIIGEDFLRLAHSSAINDAISQDSMLYSDPKAVYVEDGYAKRQFSELTYEGDFENVFYEDESGEFEFIDEDDGEVKRYSKANFRDWDYDCGMERVLESQHGIKYSLYYIGDYEEISVNVYKSDYYIPQDYPSQEYVAYYKAVTEDGREFYLSETSPFFADDYDTVFELIEKDEFEE